MATAGPKAGTTHARPKTKDEKGKDKAKAPVFPSDFGSHGSMINEELNGKIAEAKQDAGEDFADRQRLPELASQAAKNPGDGNDDQPLQQDQFGVGLDGRGVHERRCKYAERAGAARKKCNPIPGARNSVVQVGDLRA